MKRPIYYAGWTLWYLLSLFVWRIFLKHNINIKCVLILSIILGLLIGAIDKYNFLLVFSRTFTFLAFFLFGYYSNSSIIKKVKNYSKIVSSLGLICMGLFAFLITKYELISYKFLYMSESYKNFGLKIFQGILLRILFYILAILVSIFVINLVSSRKQSLSKLGSNTLIIYLGHIYILRWINKLVPDTNSTIIILFISLAFSILICLILSLPILINIYKYVFGKINYCMDNIIS